MGEATVASVRRRAAHLGPERRRPQVLDAAKAIALADGMPAVTIGAIADHLGVTRPVVYSCYTNRVELIADLLAREEQTLTNGVLAAYPTPGHYASTEDAYVGGMRALLRTVAEHPGTWRTLFESHPGRDIADMVARGRRRVAEQFAALVRPDLQRWETADAERKIPVLVDVFVSMAESGVRSLLDDANTYTPDELGDLVGRAAYRAVRGF